MILTRVFKSGNSQAVRLPVGFQITENEVEIFKRGDEIILRSKPKNLTRAFHILTEFSEDFFSEPRVDLPPEERDF